MSLSADDKLRIALSVSTTSASTSSRAASRAPTPRTSSFFELRRGELELRRELVAFGSTRRQGVARRGRPGLRVLADAVPGRRASSARPGTCTSSKVCRSTLDENLRMIAESVAYLRAQGKRVIFDAEHFFDGYSRRPGLRRSRPAARPPTPAPSCSCLCDTNGGDAAAASRERSCRAVGARSRRAASASTATTTPSARWPTRLLAVAAGAVHVQGTVNGYGERCGNANLVSIIPALELKMGCRCVSADQLACSPSGALRRRDRQHPPRRTSALRGPRRLRAQGRPARRRRRAPPQTFEHIDPGAGRQLSSASSCPSSPAGRRRCARRANSASTSRATANASAAILDATQGARAPGLPLRGRRRLARALLTSSSATTSRCSRSRASA